MCKIISTHSNTQQERLKDLKLWRHSRGAPVPRRPGKLGDYQSCAGLFRDM